MQDLIDIPISIHNFFHNATTCYECTLTLEKDNSLTLRLDDYGENPSLYTVEAIGETSKGKLYHSHHHTYFLLAKEDTAFVVLVRSV